MDCAGSIPMSKPLKAVDPSEDARDTTGALAEMSMGALIEGHVRRSPDRTAILGTESERFHIGSLAIRYRRCAMRFETQGLGPTPASVWRSPAGSSRLSRRSRRPAMRRAFLSIPGFQATNLCANSIGSISTRSSCQAGVSFLLESPGRLSERSVFGAKDCNRSF